MVKHVAIKAKLKFMHVFIVFYINDGIVVNLC